jgi:hypothetical protein
VRVQIWQVLESTGVIGLHWTHTEFYCGWSDLVHSKRRPFHPFSHLLSMSAIGKHRSSRDAPSRDDRCSRLLTVVSHTDVPLGSRAQLHRRLEASDQPGPQPSTAFPRRGMQPRSRARFLGWAGRLFAFMDCKATRGRPGLRKRALVENTTTRPIQCRYLNPKWTIRAETTAVVTEMFSGPGTFSLAISLTVAY